MRVHLNSTNGAHGLVNMKRIMYARVLTFFHSSF